MYTEKGHIFIWKRDFLPKKDTYLYTEKRHRFLYGRRIYIFDIIKKSIGKSWMMDIGSFCLSPNTNKFLSLNNTFR